jgi:hypothetical protein
MQANTIASPEALKKAGWENTGSQFGGYQIWKKQESRLLYDHEKEKVHLVY